jgi:oligopeptidase B
LPLTQLEFQEFGNPTQSLEDFIFNSLYSPADSASIIATPTIFVLARTAKHDSQVFTYEPIKWIRRLRENAPMGAPKLCFVDGAHGHFTPPEATTEQWATDCALLESWLQKDLPSAAKNI